MQRKQKGLRLSASRLLADGGQMVYSTCTYAPEENEAVVDWLLRKTDGKLQLEEVNIPGIKTYPCLTQWGKKTYHSEISKCMRVLPSERMEGFFVASFRKV